MKVLITGVAGLLGSHFSRHLLNKGYDVVGIDSLFGGYKEYVDSRVKFYEIDLIDSLSINKLFEEEKFDLVYHFAAYAAEGLSPFIRTFNYTNNVICSTNIINACINYNVKKIIFTSSMAVYGNAKAPFVETMTPNPIDCYGIAKYAVEMDLRNAYEQFGLRYSIVRPHNIIGIYQNIWDKYRNVIGIWINNILNNQPILVYGDGEQKRAFSDVSFYMDPFEQLGVSDIVGEVFNLGSDKEYTLNEISDILKEICLEIGIQITKEHREARHEVKEAYSNHDKAKTLLNFNDSTDIKETIRQMLQWAISQPNREQKEMTYEIEKNMYSFWKKV